MANKEAHHHHRLSYVHIIYEKAIEVEEVSTDRGGCGIKSAVTNSSGSHILERTLMARTVDIIALIWNRLSGKRILLQPGRSSMQPWIRYANRFRAIYRVNLAESDPISEYIYGTISPSLLRTCTVPGQNHV